MEGREVLMLERVQRHFRERIQEEMMACRKREFLKMLQRMEEEKKGQPAATSDESDQA